VKYSFIIPYYNRAEQFYNTMITYRHWYGNRNDIEIIVVEDGANVENESMHNDLVDVLCAFGDMNWYHVEAKAKNQYNPVLHRNLAVKQASGYWIVNTSPECAHRMDILSAIDTVVAPKLDGGLVRPLKRKYTFPEGYGPNHKDWKNPGKSSMRNKYLLVMAPDYNDTSSPTYGPNPGYIICACECCKYGEKTHESIAELTGALEHMQWFQHSLHNNRRLHWCSFITKTDYEKIGGFDESYQKFCGYDDDDFREKVRAAGIPLVVRDDLVVVHLNHPRVHQSGTKAMSVAGLEYYRNKWNDPTARMFK